ncbi:hypothetical protein ACFWOJ_39610 [Streptomyces sp. NPDC058439]|uniref:hypothetical protein n=1 Tax=Streptomyces sp. NPDC058439 TaxID=3346500 RepID=UPI0036524264
MCDGAISGSGLLVVVERFLFGGVLSGQTVLARGLIVTVFVFVRVGPDPVGCRNIGVAGGKGEQLDGVREVLVAQALKMDDQVRAGKHDGLAGALAGQRPGVGRAVSKGGTGGDDRGRRVGLLGESVEETVGVGSVGQVLGEDDVRGPGPLGVVGQPGGPQRVGADAGEGAALVGGVSFHVGGGVGQVFGPGDAFGGGLFEAGRHVCQGGDFQVSR